jgi:hypothetical protein
MMRTDAPHRPVDLPRIRAALRRLDELAVEYPHLIGPAGGATEAEWMATLEEVLDRPVDDDEPDAATEEEP